MALSDSPVTLNHEAVSSVDEHLIQIFDSPCSTRALHLALVCQRFP